MDINIPDMLLSLRHDLQAEQDAIWRVGMKAWEFGFQHPLLYEIGGKFASLATNAFTQVTGSDHIEKLPPPLDGWTDYRDFPAFAKQSFRDWWRTNRKS